MACTYKSKWLTPTLAAISATAAISSTLSSSQHWFFPHYKSSVLSFIFFNYFFLSFLDQFIYWGGNWGTWRFPSSPPWRNVLPRGKVELGLSRYSSPFCPLFGFWGSDTTSNQNVLFFFFFLSLFFHLCFWLYSLTKKKQRQNKFKETIYFTINLG